MPSPTRRQILSGSVTLAATALAGCSALRSGDHPAGTLQLSNSHDLPHTVRMEVTDVGVEPGDGSGTVTGDPTVEPAQRSLTATTTLDPGETEVHKSVFTEPVWYAIRFTVDGESPANDTGRVAYNPAPAGESTGRMLAGLIDLNGNFGWRISSTANRDLEAT